MSFFRKTSVKKNRSSVKGKTPNPHPGSGNGRTSEKQNGSIGEIPGGVDSQPKPGLLIIQDDYHPGDLGVSCNSQGASSSKESKLTKCLHDILHDHEAIPYLIQYMESCKASSLIRFWLDAESFQASTWTRIRTHSLNTVSKSSLVSEQGNGMKKSKSINKDITSPLSSAVSDDSAYVESKSEATDALSYSSDSHNPPVCDNIDNRLDGSSSHEMSPLGEQIHNNGAMQGQGSIEEISMTQKQNITSLTCTGDDRTREKCKVEVDKTSLKLPLESCDKAVSAGASDTGSAISYRDITSPSPTEQDRVPSRSSSFKSSTPSGASKDMLAEKLKKSVEQDAVRIFTKYLAMEATHPIGISEDLRNDTIRKICREDGQVDPECFVECQEFAVDKISKLYFDEFRASVYHAKYQVDILTSGKLCLADVVYNETALFYFMEFMEQEGLSHLLHFVIAADNFEQLLSFQDTYDGQQAQGDAMVLYDKYFSLQAACPLGFPDSIRFQVEGNICREEGPLPDCFSKPRFIVLHTIEKLHFPRYMSSDTYCRYLSELVSAVQTAQDFPLGQRKPRRGSESSSEHSVSGLSVVSGQSVGSESISSRNTLLATGTSRVHLNKLDENIKNMTFDPSLLNPDTLWQRRDSGGLTLGKIDSLGQFVSTLDPGPEIEGNGKKKPAAGSRFFRSKREKEKEQEEMAKKVAEMILQDVTSVTQAISAIRHPTTSES